MPTKWVQETRPQFLTLSVVLVIHGAALGYWKEPGSFPWVPVLLAMLGLVLLQASVNVLNDWHDYTRSGIDRQTRQTPFSGGSGMLPAGKMTPPQALALGVGTLAAGCAIGLYLVSISGPELLWIGIVGALSVVLYTPLFTRIGLGELFAGLALGVFPVVGIYFLVTGRLDAVAWISSIPAGLLTYNLLLLNEFPDAQYDEAGGRHHMVVVLGKERARWLYVAVEAATYVAIAAGVAWSVLPVWALLGLGALFFAIRAMRGTLRDFASFEQLIPAMGANVAAVLATNVLLAAGYVVTAFTL